MTLDESPKDCFLENTVAYQLVDFVVHDYFVDFTDDVVQRLLGIQDAGLEVD